MSRTLHLYLPDNVYSELQRLARERGMKVTDLTRFLLYEALKLLKQGKLSIGPSLEKEEVENEQPNINDAVIAKLLEIQSAIEALKQSMEDRIVELESQIFELQEELRKLKAKVNKLEDAYEDLVNPIPVEQVTPAR